MPSSRQLKLASPEVSHNLLGQRLGRKGQETRERILSAALHILESGLKGPLTLTGVAREASVAMTTLYLYFPDLGELILAALIRVMNTAEAAFMDRLRPRWPDEALCDRAREFIRAHYEFWRRHAAILHLRNSFADARDLRFLDYRHRMMRPLLDLLVMQMDGGPNDADASCSDLATVLLTGFERVAAVVTNPNFPVVAIDAGRDGEPDYIARLIMAEAKVIEVTIRHQRAEARATQQIMRESLC